MSDALFASDDRVLGESDRDERLLHSTVSDEVPGENPGAAPTVTPSAPLVPASEFRSTIETVVAGTDPSGWSVLAGTIVRKTIGGVSDPFAFGALTRAAIEAFLEEITGETADDRKSGLLEFDRELLRTILEDDALLDVLQADRNLQRNFACFLIGVFEGMGKSSLGDDATVESVLTGHLGILALQPAFSLAFAAGTVYQIVQDAKDTVDLVVDAIGHLDEFDELAAKLPGAVARGVRYLIDDRSADELRQIGQAIGQVLGDQLDRDLSLDVDLENRSLLENAESIVKTGFNLGVYFGPLVLDVALTLSGVGFVEVALKYLAKAAKYTVQVVETIVEAVESFLASASPELLALMKALAKKVDDLIELKITSYVEDAAAKTGIPAERLEGGFLTIRETLGEEKFREYLSRTFCTLT